MKKNGLIVILVSVWIILSVIFGIYDLDISKSFVNQNSGWAKFLEDYGMIPGLIVILSGIYINYSSISNKSDLWSYMKKVIFYLSTAGLLFYLMYIFISNFTGEEYFENHIIVLATVCLFISLVILSVLQIKKPIQNTLVIKFSNAVIGMALFGYVLCIQVVKTFWGRVRFRELDAAFSQFTPWYLPQGITGFDSFPSGHAAMGWMLLPVFVLLSKKTNLIKYSVLALIIIWAIVLSFSRVVIGAHYASDVLFGSFFIIIIFLLFLKVNNSQIK